MKKYLKDKNGKFKGSLPDPTLLPINPNSNAIPPLPEPSIVESYRDNNGNLAFRETEASRRDFLRNLFRH
jgi:hypothetical protein